VVEPNASPLTHGASPTLSLAASAPEPDPIGFLRSQGYEALDEIGRGGMGIVLKARQIGMGRLCALKVIRANRLDNPRVHARFLREVKAAARLSHPNLVTVFHTNLEGPVKFLAMEYVPGQTLVKIVQTEGPLPVPLALDFLRQTAEGLQHSFEQQMVHRDIKPSNLMVTPWPVPPGKKATIKILDMGLARQLDDEEDMGLTQAGEILGTPDYIAPEQADDPRLVDVRSDLYSLGASFFVLLTGRLPFEGTSLMQKLRKHMIEIPPLVHTIRPEVPPAVSSLIAKLLAKNPNDRFQTPIELVEACEDLIRGRMPLSGALASSNGVSPITTPMPRNPTNGPSTLNTGAIVNKPAFLLGHEGPVLSLALSLDGNYLLSGGIDETIRMWDARTRRMIRQFESKGGPVTHVEFAPDLKFAATVSTRILNEPNQVDIWEVATGRSRGRLRGMKTPICSLAYSRDGQRIAAGSEDGMVILWTLGSQTPPRRLLAHKVPVNGTAFVGSGEKLLTSGRDGTIHLWDCATGAPKGTLQGRVPNIRTMTMSGSRVAIGGDQFKIRFGDGTFLSLIGHQAPITSIKFSPARQHVVSASEDGTIRIWALESSEEVEIFPAWKGPIYDIALAPYVPMLFSAGHDGAILQRVLTTAGLI